LKKKALSLKLKPLFKAGLAAAAVIAIGFALLFNAPAAKAVTIEKICRAIENAMNVYIATFEPGKTEPEQERWVSRTFNIYMSKTEKESVLSDIPKKIRIVKNLDTRLVETSFLTTETITGIENIITGSLGLVPPTVLSVVPEDAELKRVTNYGREFVAEGTEAYDLTWIKTALDGSIGFRKWRVFVDSKTNLPLRTETYRKLDSETEYTLVSVKAVEYLSDSEMESVIQEASF